MKAYDSLGSRKLLWRHLGGEAVSLHMDWRGKSDVGRCCEIHNSGHASTVYQLAVLSP